MTKTKRPRKFRAKWSDYKCQRWQDGKDTGRRHFRIGSLSVEVHNPKQGLIPEMSRGKDEWRVRLHDGYDYVELSGLTDCSWTKRERAMRAAQTTIRHLLKIAPAMVTPRVTWGCEQTWPTREPLTEPRS